jgi:hypothetical protein
VTTVTESLSLGPSQKRFVLGTFHIVPDVEGMTGDTCHISLYVQRHIARHGHGRYEIDGVRGPSVYFMISFMTAGAGNFDAFYEGDTAVRKRQMVMAFKASDALCRISCYGDASRRVKE